jgi:hypothetical protein
MIISSKGQNKNANIINSSCNSVSGKSNLAAHFRQGETNRKNLNAPSGNDKIIRSSELSEKYK